MNHHTFRAEWSRGHSEYVTGCIEIPSLLRWAPTMQLG